jgi:hypothetical protein
VLGHVPEPRPLPHRARGTRPGWPSEQWCSWKVGIRPAGCRGSRGAVGGPLLEAPRSMRIQMQDGRTRSSVP